MPVAYPDHPAEVCERPGERVRPEDLPAHAHAEHGRRPFEEGGDLLVDFRLIEQPFEDDAYPVTSAPEEVTHSGTVPDPRYQHYREEVQQSPLFPVPVAAERDIQIFLEPFAERDMPSPPEFADRCGDIWEIEIFGDIESHDL